jgi:SAM-dependent methyltransferase
MFDLVRKIVSSLASINLLALPAVCHYYTVIRAFYFVKIKRRLRVLNSDSTVSANASHNLRSLFRANHRMQLLLYPLATIETLHRKANILVIGPRNENDLHRLSGLGFEARGVIGLDLLSYSPRIQLGDMHAIPFPDGCFDAVVCGWTLSYSTRPQLAIDEMLRVTREGGIIAIGVEYSTMDEADEKALTGYVIQEPDKAGKRINSTQALRELCRDHIGHVYFEHDAPNRVSHSRHGLAKDVSNVALIFSKRQ